MHVVFPPESPLHLFTAEEVKALFAAGRELECAADEVIVREGDRGDSMFFVLDGYAGARIEGGATMARSYHPGTYFGELSFINPGHLRSTTIIATTRVRLQIIDQASVQRLLATHPRVVFTLLQRACVFLVDAERNLMADLRRRNVELSETIKKLDLTRLRLDEEELTARTDFLTGLTNRRGFDTELPLFIERASALNTKLAVIAMDLDGFKDINDSLGHGAGDELLRGVGRLLLKGLQRTDLPSRSGGDEFLLLVEGLDEPSVRSRAEVVRAAIGVMPHPGNERGLRVTATMGGAFARPGESAAALVNRADEVLYAAKRAGRDRLGWS